MAKPSKGRLNLLRLISDHSDNRGWVCFTSFTSLELKKYDLTTSDTALITFARKAGLIETKKYGIFGKLTEAGKKLLNTNQQPQRQRGNKKEDQGNDEHYRCSKADKKIKGQDPANDSIKTNSCSQVGP